MPRIKSPTQVRDDFDRIALGCAGAAEESQPYDRIVTSLVPANCRRVLDLGCGSGDVISTAEEITHMRDRFFPGAVIRQHFLWRYTLVWLNRG